MGAQRKNGNWGNLKLFAKTFALLIFLALGASQAGAENRGTTTTFISLEEAISFISGRIEAGDAVGLASACTGPGWARDARHVDSMLTRLAQVNALTPLTKLYAEREFPATKNYLELGGHGKELGHITISFEKVGEKWALRSISMCR